MWINNPGHARVTKNEQADKPGHRMDITNGPQLSKAEVLRNFLSKNRPSHESTDCHEERGAESGRNWRFTLQSSKQSAFNQENIGTVQG